MMESRLEAVFRFRLKPGFQRFTPSQPNWKRSHPPWLRAQLRRCLYKYTLIGWHRQVPGSQNLEDFFCGVGWPSQAVSDGAGSRFSIRSRTQGVLEASGSALESVAPLRQIESRVGGISVRETTCQDWAALRDRLSHGRGELLKVSSRDVQSITVWLEFEPG